METKIDIKKEYEKYAKKYSLPNYEDLNAEFEFQVQEFEKIPFLLRGIRRKMNDKLIFYCRIIENILYPNAQNPLGMMESNQFDDNEKNNLAQLHHKLMVYERMSLIIDVSPEEKKDAAFIKDLNEAWPSFKNELDKISRKLMTLWNTDEIKTKELYFG